MNIYLEIIIVIASATLGFILSYFVARRVGNKAYEPDFVNAQLALQEKNFSEAAKLFEEVIATIERENPLYLNALAGLSQAYQGSGDKTKAHKYLEQAIEIAEHMKNPIFKSQLFKLKKHLVMEKMDVTNDKTLSHDHLDS